MNNITTKKSGPIPGSELSVGQYIKYESDASDTYPSEEAHNGYGLQNISQETLNWRVLSVDENSVKIISDSTSKIVYYSSTEGYNNAVKDLNDMCESLYSHGDTKARSVNLDDFTNKSQKYTSGLYSATCPTIYPQEKVAGGSLDQSQQTGWVTGSTTSTNKMGTNYWSGSLQYTDSLYSSTSYFLASRCVWYEYASFSSSYNVQFAREALYYEWLFGTDGVPSGNGNRVRVIVSLPASCKYKPNGDASSSSSAYDIVW